MEIRIISLFVIFISLSLPAWQHFSKRQSLFGQNLFKVEFLTDEQLINDTKKENIEEQEEQKQSFKIFKLIDILQSIGYDPELLLKSALNSDMAQLRKVKYFLRNKIAPVVSSACIGDLLYFSDSLIEYAAARYDMSHYCRKKTADASTVPGGPPISANCTCAEKVEGQLDSTKWSIDVLDSFGKVPAGLLRGNFWIMGDFEQCAEISVFKSSQKHKWEGHYCRVDVSMYEEEWAVNVTSILDEKFQEELISRPDVGEAFVMRPVSLNPHGGKCSSSLKFKVGTCFPRSCTKTDVQSIVGIAINFPQRTVGKQIVCDTIVNCHNDLDIREDWGALIVLFLIISIALLMLFGTCYDYYVHRSIVMHLPKTKLDLTFDKNLNYDSLLKETRQEYFSRQPNFIKIALAFSVYSNGKRIFSTTQKAGQIHCLHGLRALSMFWVIFGHSYYWITNYLDNPLAAFTLPNNILNHVILNASISVDAFYLLSATLLVFLWMKEMRKTNGKNVLNGGIWSMMYIHRYIRLTPVYVIVMLIDIFLMRYISDGPMWNQKGIEPNFCSKSWWTNLLYINNFIGVKEQCMTWAWYLANDMQFFALSPPILILLWKFNIAGLVVIMGLLVGTSLIRMSIIMWSQFDYPPISILLNDESKLALIEDFWRDVYIKPYCRCGPYLVGLLLGYALYKVNLKAQLSRKVNLLGWAASTALALGILFGLYDYSKTAQITVFGKAIYAAFARPLWAMSLSWVVFSCSNGYGGLINSFLSWKFWMPISRLVYCAYLVHPLVIIIFYTSQMKPIHYDGHYTVLLWYFSHLIVSFSCALILSLAFEGPVQSLEKILFQRKAPSRRSSSSLIQGKNCETKTCLLTSNSTMGNAPPSQNRNEDK